MWKRKTTKTNKTISLFVHLGRRRTPHKVVRVGRQQTGRLPGALKTIGSACARRSWRARKPSGMMILAWDPACFLRAGGTPPPVRSCARMAARRCGATHAAQRRVAAPCAKISQRPHARIVSARRQDVLHFRATAFSSISWRKTLSCAYRTNGHGDVATRHQRNMRTPL